MDRRRKLIDRLIRFGSPQDDVAAGRLTASAHPKSETEEHLHNVFKDVEFLKREIQHYSDQLLRLREELDSSQSRYWKIFEFSPICYFTLDNNDRICEVNRWTYHTLGLDRVSMLKRPIFSFIAGPSHNRLKSFLRNRETDEDNSTSTSRTIELLFKHKDGREIPTLMRILEIDEPIEGGARFLVAAVDITDRKAAEDALRESERRYRDHIDNIGDIVYVLHEDRKISYINTSLERIIGRTSHAVQDKDFADIISPQSRERLNDFLRTRLGPEHPYSFEIDIPDKKGRKRTFEVSETLVCLDGNSREIHGIGRDITEQKKYLNTIFESIADGVCSVDRDFVITSFNAAAEKITNVPRTTAVGKTCREILQSSLCDGTCPIQNSVETGKPIIVTSTRIVTADGARVPISLSATALRDEDGAVVGGVITFRDLSLIEDLRREISEKYSYQDIVSRNKKIREIFDILPDIASSNTTVLIEGRSGTGKELFARAIHDLSHRKGGPFVAINCAALPETLLESELFGYVKGAFTNAIKDKPGRFAVARGGTIFLDEIAEMTPALQVKLLRVLQERKYEPLGSVRTETADVRVIASSNRVLSGEMDAGKFREDLYYRLNIVKIQLPDLANRREDIPLLVDHFIRKISVKTGKQIDGVSEDALELLMEYDYPGNIRELENIIEHAFVLCKGPLLMVSHLPGEFVAAVGFVNRGAETDLNELMTAEKRIIEEALIRYKGNKSKVAQSLNIGRTTLWRKIKEYGLE